MFVCLFVCLFVVVVAVIVIVIVVVVVAVVVVGCPMNCSAMLRVFVCWFLLKKMRKDVVSPSMQTDSRILGASHSKKNHCAVVGWARPGHAAGAHSPGTQPMLTA